MLRIWHYKLLEVLPDLAEIMLRYMREKYHNPSSIYSDDIRKDISDASNTIRLFTNAKRANYNWRMSLW